MPELDIFLTDELDGMYSILVLLHMLIPKFTNRSDPIYTPRMAAVRANNGAK